MIVEQPGIKYRLTRTDGSEIPIQFCHKDSTGSFLHGITNEELVMVLKDRFRFLASLDDSPENVRNEVYINQIHLQLVQRQKGKPQKEKR